MAKEAFQKLGMALEMAKKTTWIT